MAAAGGVDRLRQGRARWRRATGAASSAAAERRVEMAAIAVDEEVHLMSELDHDLRALEEVVLAAAERRLHRRTP